MSDKEHKIRARAYELWEREGRGHGSHDRHWLEATRQVEAEEAASVRPAAVKSAAGKPASAKAAAPADAAKPAAAKPRKARAPKAAAEGKAKA